MSLPAVDLRTREFCSLRLALRADLALSPSVATGTPCYVIEDPVASKFYYVGLREYQFLALLDGRRTVGEVLQHVATSGGAALTEREAAALCRWLVDSQLVSQAGNLAALTLPADRPERDSKSSARFNPLIFKLGVFNPDRWLETLECHIGWLFGPTAAVGWLLAVVAGIVAVLSEQHRLQSASQGILATDNWLWLGLCWIGLKFVHEAAHGIVCKRYGGDVRDAGLMFILLTPVAYVNMTSAWRFRSKWQRIHASVAGMYAECLVAAIAALLWSRSEGGPWSFLAFNVMIMASVTTIAFNANPLMRFDGYYVLADWLEIPGLAQQASEWLRGVVRQFLLGIPQKATDLPPGQRGVIRGYAILAAGWRGVVTISLLLTASVMFQGAGIVLAILGALLWLLVPLLKWLHGDLWQRPKTWLRFSLTSGAGIAVVLALFTVIPWVGPHRAPAVVEHAGLAVVRAEASGFVDELLVRPGDHVAAGQILAVLRNPELLLEREDLELALEKAELKARGLQREGKRAEYQGERDRIAALELRLAEKNAEVAALLVRAPRAGTVMGRKLETLSGGYLPKGEEVLAIGGEDGKELRVSLAQHDVQSFASQVGQHVRIQLDDGQVWKGSLQKLEPLASLQPPHAALGAHAGGPIPVRARKDDAAAANDDEPRHEFLSPRFTALVPLDPEISPSVFAGQLAEVSFRTGDETFGGHLVTLSRRWLKEKLDQWTRRANG